MGNNSSQQLDPSYTLRLPDGTAYLGLPIRVAVSRSRAPVESGAYVCLCNSTGRRSIQWKWLKEGSDTIFDAVTVADCPTGQLTLNLFVNGGIIARGSLRQSLSFQAVNPAKSLNVVHRDGQLRCTVELIRSLPSASLVLCFDGLRLGVCSIPSSDSCGEYGLPLPRLSGNYEVSLRCSASSGSEGALIIRNVRVDIADENYHLAMRDPHRASATVKSLVAAPHTPVQLLVRGPVQPSRDILALLPITSVGPPNLKALQNPEDYVGIHPDGTASFTPTRVGFYVVSLALCHSSNRYLSGDYCTLLVTENGDADVGAGEAQHKDPVPTAAPPPRTAPPQQPPATSEVCCCICMDKLPEIKLDPCRHVCVCEACYRDLRSQGGAESSFSCPVCRVRSTGSERVYL